jgi:hypothetical protein
MALALAACATPSPTPSGATSLPTASPGSEVLDLTTIPMFVDNPLLAGDRMMKVGFADGRITRELALTRTEERWYADSWMTGGRVAYAVSDPDLTEIHVITAATGDISTFEVEGHPAITALILAPDGGSAFYVGWQRRVPYLQGNSVLEAGTGVWRLDLSVDAVPVRILPPATPTSGSPFWLDGEVDSALFIASDGGTLVAADSVGTGAARIRVVDFATGSTVDRSTEAIVYPQGVSGRDLVGVSAEWRLVVLDLDSGLARQILARFSSLALQRTAPIAAYTDQPSDPKTELHVIDVHSGVEAIAFRSEVHYDPGWPGMIEAPADWIFIESECPRPDSVGALLNWHTGELVPLGWEEAPSGFCNGEG